jgi:hypothetical protein
MTAILTAPRGMHVIAENGAIVIDEPVFRPGECDQPWFDFEVPGGGTQRDRFRGAQDAINRLATGWTPGKDELRGAPTLTNWKPLVFSVGAFALRGIVHGHPILPDGRLVVTSLVIGYDGRLARWARTVSRWYVLGRARRGGVR